MAKIDSYSLDTSLTDTDSLLGINAADGSTKRYAMSAIKTYVASVADINAVTAGTGLTGGGTSGSVTLTVGAAQTSITSIFATDVKIGEDDETKIDFETANTINFYAGNEKQLILTDGALTPGSNAIVDLGTDALEFKDAYFDGTVEADAITVGGTNISSIYSPIAGSTSLVTAGTITTGTWRGSLIGIDYGGTGLSGETDGMIVIADGSGAATHLDVGSSTGITILGTIATGVWQGTAIDTAYLDTTLTSQTSMLNTSLVVGRDADNQVKFSTDDQIIFRVAGGDGVTLKASGEIAATSLDISGNVDVDGTLEADAITVDGSTLASVIAGTTVSNATLAATATVTDSSANTNFPVVFHNESNGLLDDTGALRYNPSTGELLVPKLTVAGTTTTVDTVTMNASNAIIFEGATADSNETTLSIVDPTSDHTQYLINQGGYIPVLSAATTTAITATPAEINLIDGGTARGTTAVASGDGILINDGGTMRMTNVDTVSTYFASHNVGGSNIVTTGALNSGSITSGFGTIDTGSSNITTTGVGSFGSLDISGNVDVDGTMEADAYTVDGDTLAEYIADTTGAMFTSNTETFITATYQDADNTVDLVVPVLDEDDMSTDSASHLATQQSIKAYVDSQSGVPTSLGTITQDTITFTSANSTDPLFVIKNTTNDANAARMHFIKDKGAAGADGDDIGTIEFISDDAGQTQTSFAKIVAEVSEADNTDEAGKLSFYVAESDGTNTALTAGLVLEGEHATDGEVDVTIGAGAASTVTIPGHIDLAGDIDVDGTLEADAITVAGTALATYIRDTVGTNMLSSNTESGITVTYDTSNDNIDFAIDAAQTGITSLLATDIKIGEDDQTKIDFETADTINFYAGNEKQLVLTDGALTPGTNAIVDLGTDALEFKDAYFDGTVEADAITIGGTNIVTGSLITTLGTISSGTWQGTAIAQSYIANDAINGDKIADDAINSEHYTDGSIDTAHLGDLQVTTAKIAADAITGAKLADDAVDSEHYTDGSIDTAHIADDQVTHAKLENRYTAKATSTSTGNQNLDASAATTFLLTGNVGTATLTIQNLKLGQAIDIVLSGTLSSAAITLATNFSSTTIRKVGSTELDTSATNVITVVCIDDTDAAALVHYTINTFATDTTP